MGPGCNRLLGDCSEQIRPNEHEQMNKWTNEQMPNEQILFCMYSNHSCAKRFSFHFLGGCQKMPKIGQKCFGTFWGSIYCRLGGSGLRDGWGSAEEKFVARKTGYSAPFSPPVFLFSSRRYFEFTSILFCTEIFVLKKWQPQRENARSPPGRNAGARRLAQFLPHIDCIKVSSLCPESYFPLSVLITNVIMLKFDKNGAKFFNSFFRAQILDFMEYFP